MPGLGDKIDDEEEGRRVGWIGPEGDEVLAQIHGPGPDQVFCVTKDKVVVGRESSHNQADICVKENSYVSRGHLVLTLDRVSKRWEVSCNGKNGVFLNSELVKKGAVPVPVMARSSLRFPSTCVQLEFLPIYSPLPSPSSSLLPLKSPTFVNGVGEVSID